MASRFCDLKHNHGLAKDWAVAETCKCEKCLRTNHDKATTSSRSVAAGSRAPRPLTIHHKNLGIGQSSMEDILQLTDLADHFN